MKPRVILRLRLGRVRVESSWSEAARAGFVEAWDAGVTTAVMAERYGISQMSVSRIARRLGRAQRGRAWRRAA